MRLHIPAGTYGVLMGASGSGKTMVFECVCGLRAYEQGTITVAEQDDRILSARCARHWLCAAGSALFPTRAWGGANAYGISVRGQRGSGDRPRACIAIAIGSAIAHRGLRPHADLKLRRW